MRKVDRTKVSAPTALTARRRKDNTTELERANAHYANPSNAGSFTFKVYSDASVKKALHELFYGKCAYCESFFGHVHPVDVEHYRPKGAITGVTGHRGYWWLAMDWENLLPSCIDCNRRREQEIPSPGGIVDLLANGRFNRSVSLQSGKNAAFPLKGGTRATGPSSPLGQEDRLLLDPSHDDPDEHLSFHVERSHLVGLVSPKYDGVQPLPDLDAQMEPELLAAAATAAGVSAMGAVSIRIYGLNRLGLVQARTKQLQDMEFLTELATGLMEIAFELEERITASGAPAHDPVNFLDGRILSKLRHYADAILGRLKGMTEDNAAYSKLAQTWVRAYIASP